MVHLFALKSKMLIDLFKSKKYRTSKGKTIKKAEPIDGRQDPWDLHSENDTGESNVVDSLSVGAWMKESAVENLDGASRRAGAVLKDSKRPCRPTRVSSVQAQSDAASEEKAIVEESESPEVTATSFQDSEPE
jgi:hypothetical protein